MPILVKARVDAERHLVHALLGHVVVQLVIATVHNFRGPNRVMPFWKGWHLPGQIWDDLADWQKKTGMDKNSIIAEPLFVNAAKHDFRPVKGSPAIEFVAPHMAGTYDITGALRPADETPGTKPVRFTAGPYQYEPEKK